MYWSIQACTENPKYSQKKLLEAINKFSNVTHYDINIQKTDVFLYTNSKTYEKEIKKIIPLTIPPKQ